jgi:hypothetical protein
MTEPLSIFDLRRKKKAVELNGGDQTVLVTGLTARQVCDHLERFPALASLSIGGTMTPMEMIKSVPGVTAAWVASALGHHGDEGAEAAAEENLSIEDTAFIIQESMPLTFSRGFGPFVERLGAVMASLTGGAGRAPATRSPTPSPLPEVPSTTEPGTSPQDSSPP